MSFSKASSSNVSRLERAAASKEAAAVDAVLVSRFVSGDESAFIEIFTRYRERIFAVALSLLRNRADAEEIVQDTFIRAHRSLKDFRGDSSLATWLHRIVINLSRNRYWYFFRRQRHATFSIDCALGDDGPTTFADLIATDEQAPAHSAALGEFSHLVEVCMRRLPRQHLEILTMRNVRSLSYEEIANTLRIEAGTVKSRLARARARLRKLIFQACPDLAGDEGIVSSLQADRG